MDAQINVIGYVGKIFKQKNGNIVASIATNRSTKASGQWENITTWFYVTVASPLNKRFLSSVKVGNLIKVSGDLIVNEKDGTTYLNVYAHSFKILVRKEEEEGDKPKKEKENPFESDTSEDDDLPF